jgi:MFS family permease
LLLRKDQIPAAAALSGAAGNLSSMLGPAIGGLVIASFGLRSAYLLDFLSFLLAIALISRARPMTPSPEAERASLRSMIEGLKFLKGKPVLQGSFLIDINAMVFGMPYALFPAVAVGLGGPKVLGLLFAAPAAGALLATLISGWTGRIHRHGLAVHVAILGWGLSLLGFGLADGLWLVLAFLATAGAADEISAIFRSTILQSVTPPHMVGRLSGVELSVVASGPSLGDLEAGAVAAVTSVRFSIVSGGIACILGLGAVALLLPEFHRYDSRETPEDVPV